MFVGGSSRQLPLGNSLLVIRPIAKDLLANLLPNAQQLTIGYMLSTILKEYGRSYNCQPVMSSWTLAIFLIIIVIFHLFI
jgi:hypothetical protein